MNNNGDKDELWHNQLLTIDEALRLAEKDIHKPIPSKYFPKPL